MNPQKILIDTDLGDDVDDVLAIAFALLRPELDVKAITAVSYDTTKRTHILAQLLQTMNRTDVPFAAGMQRPLRALAPHELETFDDTSNYRFNHYGFAKNLESLPHADEDAIALMAQTVEANPGEIAIASIAPLTNIAVFLCRYPELIPKIQHIALMGAEIELNRHEHNVAWDAVAASIVLGAGVPLFVGTWSVTKQFVLSPDDCARIKNLNTPLGDALSECIEMWWPHKAWKPGPVMYDVAPILWSYDRSFYPTEPMNLRVETKGETTLGMTRNQWGEPNAQVSVSMRADEVRELYLQTICGE